MRGKVFGEACCLTKHPLIFNGPGVTPAPHPHLSMGIRCADVTAVIKHYKFAGNTAARDAASLSSGDLAHGEDAARAAVLSQTPDVSLFSLDARKWNRAELLTRAGFLVGSARYDALEVVFEDPALANLYVLSDGAPMGGTTDDPEELLASVKRWNRKRRAIIHTISIGFRSELLASMAEKHGGLFREAD